MGNQSLCVFAVLVVLILMAYASPSDEDLKTCEKHQSTETCLHSLYP